ncbi:MAG TPA: hypothetical protein VFB12_06095, partial [Ktedonobacteraceae bacterium]|nr:hypothetical protein [Ktedonobacteraceae bacterium]
MWRGVSLLLLGLKDYHEGRLGEAPQLLQEAYACSLATDDGHFTRGALLLLGASSTARGEVHQAAEYYRQALVNARQQESYEDSASALLGLA